MLPNVIQFIVRTATQSGMVEVEKKTAKSGNAYFQGAANKLVLPGDSVTEALEATSAAFGDLELNKGQVHRTEPSVYGKTHRKAGQLIPGTGGQLTISHSGTIKLDGEKFTAVVTFIEKEDGIRLRVGVLKQRTSSPTARVEGLTFASA